jgi:hypothetical protein
VTTPTFVAGQTSGSTTEATKTHSIPAAATEGDFLILTCSARRSFSTDLTMTGPAGWTQLYNYNTGTAIFGVTYVVGAWWKYAAEDEPVPSTTLNGDYLQGGGITAWRGVTGAPRVALTSKPIAGDPALSSSFTPNIPGGVPALAIHVWSETSAFGTPGTKTGVPTTGWNGYGFQGPTGGFQHHTGRADGSTSGLTRDVPNGTHLEAAVLVFGPGRRGPYLGLRR